MSIETKEEVEVETKVEEKEVAKQSLSDWFGSIEQKLEKPEDKKVEDKKEEETEDKFKPWDVPEFTDLETLIQAQPGETLSDKIKNFKSTYEDRVSKFDEFETKEKEREEWYREHLITESQEWKEAYQRPFEQKLDFYTSILSEVGEDGKAKRDDHYKKLREAIFNEGNDISAAQVKALFKSFNTQYKEKFGVEPELPSIKEVMDAREDVLSAFSKRAKAFQDWENIQAQRKEELTAQQRQQQKLALENVTAENHQKFDQWVAKVDANIYQQFAEPTQVKEATEAIRAELDELIKDPEKHDASVFFDRSLKARMFDELMTKFTEYKKYVEQRNLNLPKPGSTDPNDRKTETPKNLGDFFKI